MTKTVSFTYDCTLTVGNDDDGPIEVDVRLHCRGMPGTPETGRIAYGPPENYDPGSGAEIWLEKVEIGEDYAYLTNAVSEIRTRWRLAIKSDAAGPNDQAVINAAEDYVDDDPYGRLSDALDEELRE